MDIPLKDAITIIDSVKTLDWYSIWLWLSIALPIYYITFKKIIPEKPAITNIQEPIAAPIPEIPKKSLVSKLGSFLFTIPLIEPIFLYLCLAMFLVGTCVLVVGQQKKQTIRNQGWMLKNYMLSKYLYSMSQSNIRDETKLTFCEMKKIAEQYPNEFGINYGYYKDTVVVLVDDIPRKALLERSEKILASYLRNPYVLSKDSMKSFAVLFSQNNIYTYDVVYKLIVDSGYKYTFNLNKINNPEAGFGIVKSNAP
ncbi:MAG: hypothetical protein IT236_16025 [Bacteroidia bacterium]|nr:hypothetical protein [Bacteroidia bacterium]